MKPLSAALIFVSALTCFTACRKDHAETPLKQPGQLIVKLDTSYIGGNKIDSAFAVWTIGGHKSTLRLKTAGDQLVASLAEISPGDGELEVQIYSNLKFAYYSSLWLQKKQLTLVYDQDIRVDGPKAFSDLAWTPRVFLRSSTMRIDAVVGMRPNDPYFYVRHAEKNAREIWISREYWRTKQGVNKVGGGVWECKTGCFNEDGDILNVEFFKFLPTQIGERQWNHIEIVIRYLMDPAGGGYLIDMNYDIPG
jgi:hypothetical protein